MFYTAKVARHILHVNENEIKMLLAAIRQVQHTFSIAEAQSTAAGEPLSEDYIALGEAYEELYQKLSAQAAEAGAAKPRIVK